MGAVDSGLMSRFAWLLAPNADSVWFAVRVCLSVAIGLYLAFWIPLERPYWVFINIAILIQPSPGFLVVRSFARLTGTAVAGAMAVTLVALFAQSYVLFSAGLIVWVGTCVFFASLFRNNLSYGFVLAGYVTSIIAVISMSHPSTVFLTAMARVAETALAGVVSTSVSVLLAPSITAKAYFKGRLAAFRAIGAQMQKLGGDVNAQAVGAAEQDAEARHAELHELVEKTLSLEQSRQYARFEVPGFAEHDRLARRLDYELLSLVSAMASLQLYLAKFGDWVDRRPLRELHHAAELMQADPENTRPIRQAFGRAYNTILAAARRDLAAGTSRSLVDWVVISRGLDLATRTRAAVVKHGLLVAERRSGRRRSERAEFSVANEPKNALRNSARAMTAMSAGAVIWIIYHDQRATSIVMVLLSVLTTLFALTEAPIAGARGFAIGAFCAAVAAFIADFILLPYATSYATLMIVILPAVFVGGLAMKTPSIAIIGRISLVIFALLMHLRRNGAFYNFTHYSESALGVFMAVTLAIAAFSLVFPLTPRDLLRERLAGVFGELARGFTEARERFETRIYNRLLRLPVGADAGRTHVSARQAAFAAVNIGLEARSLRLLAARANFEADIQQAINHELTELQQLFVSGYPSVAQVFAVQRDANRLAQAMLARALVVDRDRRRRYAIRAAVAAELVAAALADYGLTRKNVGEPDIRLGEVGHEA